MATWNRSSVLRAGVLSLLVLVGTALSPPARAAEEFPLPDNTHLIDSNEGTGFALYRTSKASRVSDFVRLCRAGVTELMVLDGAGAYDAELSRRHCPSLQVVKNVLQASAVPVTAEFLADFDRWVEDARTHGRKIAFRCVCGCHRTGRLAAYYRMKYQGWPADTAIAEMKRLGRAMYWFPFLTPQVLALADHVARRACSQKAEYCVGGKGVILTSAWPVRTRPKP
jgi:protein-tyrosine phosphatase